MQRNGGRSSMTSRSLQREDYSPFPNNFTPKHLEKDIEDSPFFRRLKETADKEPGVLTVAQRDFVRMWHTQADGVYTLRQDFVQTAFDHIKSQGHAWSLYHDIWDNLGRSSVPFTLQFLGCGSRSPAPTAIWVHYFDSELTNGLH